MKTNYILLESVATWVDPNRFLTVGAMTKGNKLIKSVTPTQEEFKNEGVSILENDLSEFWIKSLSVKDRITINKILEDADHKKKI